MADLTCLSRFHALLGLGAFKPKDGMKDQLKTQETRRLLGII